MTIVRRKKSLKLEKKISITFLFICVCVCWQQQKTRLRILKNLHLSNIILYILAVIIFFPFFSPKLWDKKVTVTILCYSISEMALHMIILQIWNYVGE